MQTKNVEFDHLHKLDGSLLRVLFGVEIKKYGVTNYKWIMNGR